MQTSVVIACALLACSCATTWDSGSRGQQPSRILALFPHPGRSHQMVFEPLFRRLAERGHNVTVVSFFPVSEPPPPPNYRDVSLVGLADIYISKVDMKLFETGDTFVHRFIGEALGMQTLSGLATSICEKFLDWPTVHDLVRSNETFDVILVENFNSDCMLGFAHHYGAPFVALLSHNLMAWSSDRMGLEDNPSYVPSMATKFTTEMSFLERLENTLFLYGLKIIYKFGIQNKEQAILDKHFGHRTKDLGELSRSYSLMLVNTHHTLNGVRPLVPGVVEVGGMHLERPKQTIPSEVERFLNESTHGVILFSFGSLLKADSMPKARLDSFLKAFARIPQRVIWKWDGEDFKQDNIMTLRWLPQYELLKHPKVVGFVAHGGMLGVTEAADAGVPMVVVPFFGDQPLNAAAAARAGLAAVLPFVEVTEHTVYQALQQILSPEMQASAAAASRAWHDRPAAPLDTAVFWVERTARLGHRQQMAAHARRLPAHQRALLDVALALVALLLLVLVAIYYIVKTTVAFVRNLTKSKLKTN